MRGGGSSAAGSSSKSSPSARMPDPGGIFITMLLGVAGALLAGFLGRSLGWYHENEGAGLIASILGSVILLGLYRMVSGRRQLAV